MEIKFKFLFKRLHVPLENKFFEMFMSFSSGSCRHLTNSLFALEHLHKIFLLVAHLFKPTTGLGTSGGFCFSVLNFLNFCYLNCCFVASALVLIAFWMHTYRSCSIASLSTSSVGAILLFAFLKVLSQQGITFSINMSENSLSLM